MRYSILLYILIFAMSGCSENEKIQADKMLRSRPQDLCCTLFPKIYKLCEEKKIDSCILECEKHLKNDYKGDNYLELLLATAYYATGNKEKAIYYLSESLDGDYLCDCTRPVGNSMLLEKAIIHYCLSTVYNEIGDYDRSKKEAEDALNLSKEYLGDKYNEVNLNKVINRSKGTLGFLSKEAVGDGQ